MKSSTCELDLTNLKIVGRRFHCSQCFSIKRFTHVASSYANWKKRTSLHKKKVQLPQEGFGTPAWRSRCHVKTIQLSNNPISNRSF